MFYLVIDGEREEKNVYFLNAVTEADLTALAEKDAGSQVSAIPEACTCREKCEAGMVDTSCQICRNDLTGCTGKEAPAEEPEPEPEPQKKGTGGTGTAVFILIAMAAVCAGGYYVKIVRPRQQAQEDEDDAREEDYGEGFDPDEAFGETEYLSEDDFEDGEDFEGADSE